jgi:Uncharacterized protein conserved in bacteria
MRKKAIWIWGSIVAVVLILVGAGTLYALHYATRALPGVSVAGEKVSGQTADDIRDLLEDRYSDTAVAIRLDGQMTPASLSDLGYDIDIDATLNETFKQNGSVMNRFSALLSSNDVVPTFKTDEAKLDTFLDSLTEKHGTVVKEANVSLPEGSDTFTVEPSEAGLEVDASSIKTAATKAAETLDSTEANVTLTEVEPTFTTEKAQEIADSANEIASREISITDGVDLHTPTSFEKALWVNVSPEGAKLDDAKVRAWVEAAAAASNVEPTNGVRNVNSRGDVVAVVDEGKSGWKANNADEVAGELLTALHSGDGFYGDFDYDEIKPEEWEDRKIADGAENLVYKAAKGEKWIDINLSNFTVTAYEGATPVRGPVYMVPGAPATPTVTGQYKVYLQYDKQTMKGENADGSKYETPDVPWVTYFHEGYALHGAYWRSEFGYGGAGGSHGCVNMPVDEAKWFHDWAEIGTVVVSHN